MRGKTYEVCLRVCTSWTTGRDKDVTSVGNVTLRATCSQNAWETKTYLVKQGVGLKGWGGLETAAGLDFPFHYLQRVCFSRRKTWETTSFSSLDREADSVKDDVCLFFLSQRKAFLVYFFFWEVYYLLFPDYIFRSNLCLNIMVITVWCLLCSF